MKQRVVRKWKMKTESLSQKEHGNPIYYDGKPVFNVHKIDRVAFAVGGLLYIVFNVIYWCTFSIFNFN